MHQHLDFEIARHAQPGVFPEPRHSGNDLRTQWIQGLSHPHTRLHSLSDHVRHGSRQSSLFAILTRTNVPCLRNGWFQGGKYDADLEELPNATCLFTLPWDFDFVAVYSSESSSFRRRRMMQDT
ncbi:hypothetical protein L3X38_000430 [Prunus dulcis]|uniref:Mediator complex subunit Med12 domain-containing protein n=1 Tax=Prunus dulcis TaxID=3755 RepID=A0AAD4ZJD7_PRUDU|nr:hypothetical protein L3X38_000430 [Prunus dulcis]